MTTRHTYQRTLLKACQLLGDEIELARQMGVPVRHVLEWLLGVRPLPPAAFLRAVDVVYAKAPASSSYERSRDA